MRCLSLLFCLALCCTGCVTTTPSATGGSDIVFIAPGVGGNEGYDGLMNALSERGWASQVVGWGAPPPMFFLNFSDKGIHDQAERDFAQRIQQWHTDHPQSRIAVIGHSAGCGVALGGVSQLHDFQVETLILLAPSVSPGYDLKPALAHLTGTVHVFTSRNDSLLEWRTTTFETYDRLHTAAAGVVGFKSDVPSGRLIQQEYQPAWASLGNDGGHWGPLAKPFSGQVIAPLLGKK